MEKSTPKRKVPAPVIAVIAAVVVVIILIAAYCGLCKWVRDNGRLLPNTTARDSTGQVTVDLSKMLRDDAVSLMGSHMDEHLAQRVVTIRYDGGSEQLDGSLLEVDPVSPIDYGMTYKDCQPFLRLGALWLGLVKDPVDLSLSAAVLTEEGEAEADRIARRIAEEVHIEPVGYTCQPDEAGENMVVTLGTEGRELDAGALSETLKLALLAGQAELEAEYIPLPTDEIDSQMIYDMVYQAPVDPYLQEDGTLSLPVDGVSVDLEATQALLNAAAPGETCTIPLVLTAPDFQSSWDLLFQDVLSQNVSTLDGVHERSFNVNRTAEFCNETVIMPGEVFSYLNTVGDPSVANGYMLSTGYQDGQTVEMEGGGACQISSALYYCAVYANLEIVWRANHAFTVSYLPKGLDATVYYPSTDFQFRNNTPYPIKIVAYTENGDWGTATVKLLGTKTDGTYVIPEINQLSMTEWETVYKPDETIPVGTTKVDVTPYTGYKVEVYRCVYSADGTLISRTFENTSRYSKRDKVILFNPADAASLGLNPDGTPRTQFTLTVKWVDDQGNALTAPQVEAGRAAGSSYSTQQKHFEGYTFKTTSGDPVSGVMDKDRTVTYIYTKDAPPEEPEVTDEPVETPEPDESAQPEGGALEG